MFNLRLLAKPQQFIWDFLYFFLFLFLTHYVNETVSNPYRVTGRAIFSEMYSVIQIIGCSMMMSCRRLYIYIYTFLFVLKKYKEKLT